MLVLVRHGKTTDQEENRMSGQHDCLLCEEGQRQVNELGDNLADYEFDFIFSSDLTRCRETTGAIINHSRRHVPDVMYAPELRERSGGSIEGMTYQEVRKLLPPKKYKLWRRDYFEAPPMGESLKDVEDRVLPFMKDHVFPNVNDNKHVLAIAHAGVLRTLICYLKACDESEIIKLEIENAIPYFIYGNVREE